MHEWFHSVCFKLKLESDMVPTKKLANQVVLLNMHDSYLVYIYLHGLHGLADN